MADQDPEALSKLSNFNLQEILYHQFLQSRQKQALQYPALQQNGNLTLLSNGNEPDLHNSQAYLMNSFLTGQDSKPPSNSYASHPTEDEEEANGVSRTNSPASSSHSSEFGLLKVSENFSPKNDANFAN